MIYSQVFWSLKYAINCCCCFFFLNKIYPVELTLCFIFVSKYTMYQIYYTYFLFSPFGISEINKNTLAINLRFQTPAEWFQRVGVSMCVIWKYFHFFALALFLKNILLSHQIYTMYSCAIKIPASQTIACAVLWGARAYFPFCIILIITLP